MCAAPPLRAAGTRILYGGSVSAKSAPELAVKPDIGAGRRGRNRNPERLPTARTFAPHPTPLRARGSPAPAAACFRCADGFLVGNASLKSAEFIDICKAGAIKANAHN